MESGTYRVKWLDVLNSVWSGEDQVEAGYLVELDTPGDGHWVAVIQKDE